MMVTAVTAVADQFRDLGLSTVTVQRKEITHEEITNLFWINALAGTLIALVVCAVSPLISAYYKDARLTVITCILASNFVFGGLMVQHQALLARVLKLSHSAAIRVLASLISTLLAVLLAWKGFGYWALVWKEVTRSLLLAVGMWFCFRWIPGLPSRRTDVWGLLGFGAHLSAANIVSSISGGIDRFLLGRFWGATPVAIYRQAFQLLVAPIDQLVSPVYQVTQPGLSMLQTEAERYRRFYQKVLTLVCVATMPLSLFVAVYSAEITRIVLGRKCLAVAPLHMILSFDGFIRQAVGSAAFVLITRGRSKSYLGLTMLHNATLVLLMCVGVRWGAKGITLAEVATTYLLIGPRLFYSFKDSPITLRAFFGTIGPPAIASIVMAVVLAVVHQALPPLGAPAFLAIGTFVGAVTFLGIWALLPGGKTEMLALFLDIRSALQRRRQSTTATLAVPFPTEPAAANPVSVLVPPE
jgi:PST family polysaccharide transporter